MLERADDLGVEPDREGWVHLHDARRTAPMRRAHRHDELEVNLMLQGWAEYLIGDRRVRFPQHALGWLLPPQVHRLIDRSPNLRMWIGVFRPTLVTAAGDAADAGPPPGWLREAPPDVPVHLVPESSRELAGLFTRLAATDISSARHRAGLAWLLSECWQTYRQAPPAPLGSDLHPAVQTAARWLYDHATEPGANDLSALAQRCGMSRPWLSNLFQQQIGESITDFRNRQRFHRFRDLLTTSPATPVTAAAHAAGFGSYTQCFRVVRVHTGESPRVLARQVREANRGP